MKPNQEDYLDPRWQKFRLKRLERAHWKCDRCSASTATLHVHHTSYVPGRKPWEYPSESTLVLCDSCHKNEHGLSGCDVSEKGFKNIPPIDGIAHIYMPSDPDEFAEFEELVYFENGRRVTIKRKNPRARKITPSSITPASLDRPGDRTPAAGQTTA